MIIPAYISPNLWIGGTFDITTGYPGSSIFQPDIQTRETRVNTLSFKYRLVKTSKDVNDLLDISSELSLKVKANLLTVQGAGRYINKSGTEEEVTNLLAVMKCTTVTKTIEDNVEPTNTAKLHVGTHYVRSVTYGAELVAKVTFRTSSDDKKKEIDGSTGGVLGIPQVVNVGLKTELQKLTTQFNSVANLQIDYYSTVLPNRLPTTIGQLIELIEEFPSEMRDINGGNGIPMTFELWPVSKFIPTAPEPEEGVKPHKLERMERCFDDVRRALNLANSYLKSTNEHHNDVRSFISTTNTVEEAFLEAISNLGGTDAKRQVNKCHRAYVAALDGKWVYDKFVLRWEQILAKKDPGKPSAHIESLTLKKDVTYPPDTVIRDWDVNAPYTHLEGGMEYNDGKLIVPIPGQYYIYAQIYYHNRGRVFVKVNGKPITMIQPQIPFAASGSGYTGGVFYLETGDTISLAAHDYPLKRGADIYMATYHTYFGAFLL